jgi:ribosomal protein L44E
LEKKIKLRLAFLKEDNLFIAHCTDQIKERKAYILIRWLRFFLVEPRRAQHVGPDAAVASPGLSVETTCNKYLIRRVLSYGGKAKVDEHMMLTRAQWQAMVAREKKSDGASSSSGYKEASRPAKKSDEKPKKKFDKKNLRCHNCNQLGHFKLECRNPPKEKALLAKEGDDAPMMLMLEVCKLMDNIDSTPQVPARKIITLEEDKVFLHDKARMSGTSIQVQATT